MISLVFPPSPFLLNQAVFPPLGIMYLSAYLKEHGIECQCLDFGLGHTIDDIQYDTVGISITTPQRNEAYALARDLKERGKTLIAGGPHATHRPEECKENGFDYVIGGYGERPLVEFFDIEPKCIQVMPDRDALPVRAYKYHIDGEPATVLMTSRGCPFNCSFCARISKKVEVYDAAHSLNEIMYINSVYGFRAFMIFDDVFVLNRRRLEKIVSAVEDRGFLFRCFARSHMLSDEVCQLLKRMGVREVGIGVESGANEILSNNLKGTTRGTNTQAVQNLHRHGIRAKAFLIVGLPGETTETVDQTRSWIEEAHPDDIDVSVFQPLPGSSIFSNPEKWGIKFSYDGAPQWYKGTPGEYVSVVQTKGLSSEEIVYHRDSLERMYKDSARLK